MDDKYEYVIFILVLDRDDDDDDDDNGVLVDIVSVAVNNTICFCKNCI